MIQAKKKLTINAISSIIQVAITAILFFFLYRYLLDKLGAEQLGVWSLILSFSSIANLANLGITSGLVKFVAEYLTQRNEYKIGKLIFTSIVTLTILFLIISLIISLLSKYFLHYIIDNNYLQLALHLLPISLFSLSLNAISGVFTSVLEGFQKNYLRNFIYVISGVIMFVFALILTPRYGLTGVAYAQLIQSVFIFILSLLVMYKTSIFNRFRFWKLSMSSFKEMFDYGYKFQIVSIAQLLYEPTTKFLLSRFGGLALLGHYEMATKLVGQFRALLVNANQVIIPVVAENNLTKTKTQVNTFFSNMNKVLWLFTVPLSTILIVLSPAISIVWIGYLNLDFVFAMLVLGFANSINIMCGPSYFSCMGEGKLSILILAHISIAVLNFALGWLLGSFMGGHGIILAWGLALSIGSAMLVFLYSKNIRFSYFKQFDKNEYILLVFSTVALIIGITLFNFKYIQINIWSNLVFCLILLVLYIPIVLKNESFKKIQFLLTKKQK